MTRFIKQKTDLVPFLLIFTLVFSFASIAFAGSNFRNDSFAGDTAQSYKNSYILNSVTWRSQMQSNMFGGTYIDKIGWNSWTRSEYCGGSAIDFDDRGGTLVSSTSGTNSFYSDAYSNCGPATIYLHTDGVHRYEESPYTPLTTVNFRATYSSN